MRFAALKILFLVMFFFPPDIAAVEYEPETRAERFINNFYSKPDFVENRPLLKFDLGFSGISFPLNVLDENFAGVYGVELHYGFQRYNRRLLLENVFEHKADYAFLGNHSVDFKTFDVNPDGIITDTWRFGFGIADGFGYVTGEDSELLLIHKGAIIFNHSDVDAFLGDEEMKLINGIDEKIRFGMAWTGEIRYKIAGSFHLDVGYRHTLIYPDYEFFPWFGMWLTDNVLQRWPDYFEQELFAIFIEDWPWIKFLYKNLVSYVLYDIRREQSYFPFDSGHSASFDSFKIGFTFVF